MRERIDAEKRRSSVTTGESNSRVWISISHSPRFLFVLLSSFLPVYFSMSFLAMKYRRKYRTCHVARPSKQHMPNILKNRTLLFVDSTNE